MRRGEIEAIAQCQMGPKRQANTKTSDLPSPPDDFEDLTSRNVGIVGDIRSKVALNKRALEI